MLKRAFKDREVDKRYHAVVQGHLDPLRGTVDAPIDRHPTHDYKWAVVSGGKPSVTHYDTLEAFAGASLVDVRLETGRTHQIRVHFVGAAAPVRRRPDLRRRPDAGRPARPGPAVAARRASWLRPSRRPDEQVRFVSEYPDDLAHALALLRDAALHEVASASPARSRGRGGSPRHGPGRRTRVTLVAARGRLVAGGGGAAPYGHGGRPPADAELPDRARCRRGSGSSDGDPVADVRAGEPGRARGRYRADGAPRPRLRAGHA